MWFLLLSTGAVVVALVGVPVTRRFPAEPPAEAVIALYFLAAAMIRLVVRDWRIFAGERKARAKQTSSPLHDIGFGVGRGVVQVVAGDVLAAALSLGTALLHSAASSFSVRPAPSRERRRRALREGVRALACIAGVGAVCALIAWEPVLRASLARPSPLAAGDPRRVAVIGPPATAPPQHPSAATTAATPIPTLPDASARLDGPSSAGTAPPQAGADPAVPP